MTDSLPAEKLFTRLCVVFSLWICALVVMGWTDVIDFHVCIKPAGHCKIVDPTQVEK